MKTLLLIASALLLSLPQTDQLGLVYTAHMNKFGRNSTFDVWTVDTKARFSVSQSDDPAMPVGTSIIALDSGQRYLVLLPEKQIFMELTRDQYKKFRQQKAEAEGVEIRDPILEELVVDSDGGLIAGCYSRSRIRSRTAWCNWS